MRLKEHVHGVSVIGLNSYETLFSITKGFNVSLWLILFRCETPVLTFPFITRAPASHPIINLKHGERLT